MKQILCIGDSNTFGYDPRSFFGSQYPAGIRWTGLLQSRGWQVINCGQNGLCIPREPQLPAVAELIRQAGPLYAVTVMLGSNDLLNGASAEEATAHMDRLLRCISENAGSARIILIAPPPMRFGDWVQEQATIDESVRLGPLYRQLAGRLGTEYADAGEWHVAMTFDGVHFTPEGHAAFAAGLAENLQASESVYNEISGKA